MKIKTNSILLTLLILFTPVLCEANDRTVVVSARSTTGKHVGFSVKTGEKYEIKAEGRWCWGGGDDCSGPDGTYGRPDRNEHPVTLTGANLGELIARINDSYYRIDRSKSFDIEKNGDLYLLMNDRLPTIFYSDNSGELIVAVSKVGARENIDNIVKEAEGQNWHIYIASICGLVFLIFILYVAVFIREPLPAFNQYLIRVILGVAAAGVGASIPGFLDLTLPLWQKGLIHAGGGLGLFVIIYMVNPPEIAHRHEE